MKSSTYLLVLSMALCASLSFGAAESEQSVPVPEYSEAISWVTQCANPDKAIDVFYVYPTIFGDENPPNMDISDPDLQSRAINLLTTQAGVYTNTANLFAPYYRQMSMARLDPETDMFKNEYFRIGAEDVDRAFDYYLSHLNLDRPFIIAGHSQGSMVLIDLMFRRFSDPALQKRLVAAYLIGYSITEDDLEKHPWMRIARTEDDTGVIITYNTQSPTATGSPVLVPGAMCVNPLNWTIQDEAADANQNLGAVFFKEGTAEIDREVPHYIGAVIDPAKGALITNPPDQFDLGCFPDGVYHKLDYSFWYRNLEANVATRAAAYLAQ